MLCFFKLVKIFAKKSTGTPCKSAISRTLASFIPSGWLIYSRQCNAYSTPELTNAIQPFFAKDNIATAGGCLTSQLACWVIARLEGLNAAKDAMYYVAPVGEKNEYTDQMLSNITPYLTDRY